MLRAALSTSAFLAVALVATAATAAPPTHAPRAKTAHASQSRTPRAIVLRRVRIEGRRQQPLASIDIARQPFRLPTLRHLRGSVPAVRRAR